MIEKLLNQSNPETEQIIGSKYRHTKWNKAILYIECKRVF
jgi:hypothetical protein